MIRLQMILKYPYRSPISSSVKKTFNQYFLFLAHCYCNVFCYASKPRPLVLYKKLFTEKNFSWISSRNVAAVTGFEAGSLFLLIANYPLDQVFIKQSAFVSKTGNQLTFTCCIDVAR